jgi:hypothetical protein
MLELGEHAGEGDSALLAYAIEHVVLLTCHQAFTSPAAEDL